MEVQNMSSRLPRLLRGFTTFMIGLLGIATILMVILGALLIGGDSFDADLGLPIQFDIDTDSYSLVSASWGDGEIQRVSGVANFEDPGPSVTIGVGIAIAAGLATAFVSLVLLRRIFTTMTTGTPFLPENVTRIRALGFITIGVGIATGLAEIALGLLVLNNVTSTGIDINYSFKLNLAAVFVGLVILALAEVFRYGTNLQSDSDLTV